MVGGIVARAHGARALERGRRFVRRRGIVGLPTPDGQSILQVKNRRRVTSFPCRAGRSPAYSQESTWALTKIKSKAGSKRRRAKCRKWPAKRSATRPSK